MTTDWIAPPVERKEPEGPMVEREALEDWLDYHRQTLLSKCAGLTSEQLKMRSVEPSRLTLLGLVRHMTDVERWWFRIHAGDEDMPFLYTKDDWLDADFEDLEGADARAVLEAFQHEIELARAASKDKPLDLVVHSHGDHKDRVFDVRWIYVHMVEEYARHNGHADLLRERIDGATGD